MRIIIDNNEYADVTFREIYNNVSFEIAKAINTILSEYKNVEHESKELVNTEGDF